MQHRRYTVTVEEHADSPYWYARMYLEGEGGRARRWSTKVPIGKDRRISEREATRAAQERADEIAREVLREVAADNDTSLKAVAERMLAAKTVDGRRKRAVDALAFNLDKHVLDYFGPTRDVRTIRRADLEAFKAHMRGISDAPTTVNNALTAIRQVLKHACRVDELLEAVPYVGNVPPRDKHTGKPISAVEAARFLKAFGKNEQEQREFNEFLLNTGLRKTEALSVRWAWVDFEARELRIPAEVRKGGRPQRAPTALNDAALELLRDRQKRERQPSKGRVWFQLKGGRKGARDYDRARRAAAEKAGIAGYRHHDARHTRATTLAADGATPFDLRDAMGWSTLAMTSRYTHPDRTRLHEMAGRVQFTGTGSGTGRKGSRGEDRSTSEKETRSTAVEKRRRFKAL